MIVAVQSAFARVKPLIGELCALRNARRQFAKGEWIGAASTLNHQFDDVIWVGVCNFAFARNSTIVTSQLPVEPWHEAIANPTVAQPSRKGHIEVETRVVASS